MTEHSNKLHIPLASAFLCQDCQEIGNDPLVCPACASTVLLPLAGVLDRETPTEHTAPAPQAFVCPNCHESGIGCKEFGCWKWTPEQESEARRMKTAPAPRGDDGPRS